MTPRICLEAKHLRINMLLVNHIQSSVAKNRQQIQCKEREITKKCTSKLEMFTIKCLHNAVTKYEDTKYVSLR